MPANWVNKLRKQLNERRTRLAAPTQPKPKTIANALPPTLVIGAGSFSTPSSPLFVEHPDIEAEREKALDKVVEKLADDLVAIMIERLELNKIPMNDLVEIAKEVAGKAKASLKEVDDIKKDPATLNGLSHSIAAGTMAVSAISSAPVPQIQTVKKLP